MISHQPSAEKLKLSDQENLEKLRKELNEISAMIYGLVKKLGEERIIYPSTSLSISKSPPPAIIM